MSKSKTIQQIYNECEALLEGLPGDTKAVIIATLLSRRRASDIKVALKSFEYNQVNITSRLRLELGELKELVDYAYLCI